MRADQLLVERGLAATRSQAQRLIASGLRWRDARGWHAVAKNGDEVPNAALLQLLDAAEARYVSRGGLKLEGALQAAAVDPRGLRCLDVGQSTGGFTDCLLQRGAEHVVAVDVAYGELAWSLRTDDRVTVLERVNARGLEPEQLPWAPDLVVADVSFISLTKILPAVLGVVAERFDALVMVKPQFEVGRDRVGKGGVVRDPALRREAVLMVARAAQALGADVLGFAPSGLPGPKGNQETFAWLAERGRDGALGDLETAVEAVDA
jgi:23S rRNA (cytidine1920-2'-O)/16S rRNA (cytidine1409-2'-O)-methyltransferase